MALTGASGFVGTQLLEALCSKGVFVQALSHKKAPHQSHQVQIIEGSLKDGRGLADLVSGVDAVIHCGGLVAARSAQDFDAINAQGTLNIVKESQKAGVKRFLLISSLAAKIPSVSAYAHSKKKAEEALSLNTQITMGWDVIRPPALYGPGDEQMLPLFKLLKLGVALTPAGRDARVSVMHVDDLCQAIMAWLKAGQTNQTVFEIDDGANQGHRWQDILGVAAEYLGVSPCYVTPPKPLLSGAALGVSMICKIMGRPVFLSKGKVRELRHSNWVSENYVQFSEKTGWKAMIPLKKGISDTLSQYQKGGRL